MATTLVALSSADAAGTLTGADTLAVQQGGVWKRTNLDDLAEFAAIDVDVLEAIDDQVANSLIQNGTGISWSYNDGLGTLTPTVTLSPFSTTDLSEGTNLYYTDGRADARVAVAIGVSVQAWDTNLDQIAALTPTDSNIIVGNGTAWVAESGATARTSLGLGNVEDTALSTWVGTANITTLGTIATGTWQGTAVQGAYTDIDLSEITDVTITTIAAGEVLKWSGTAWVNNTLAEATIASANRTITISAGSTSLTVVGGTQTLASDRVWTLDTAQDIQTTASPTFAALAISAGPLAVTGSITVTGTVDGRDIAADGSALDAHTASTANPHSVTKAQVGLGSVEDTALSTWAGTTNVTTLGTVATGTWQGTAIQGVYTDIDLSEITDVTITTIADGEVLRWNGTGWVNNTLAEATIASANRTLTVAVGSASLTVDAGAQTLASDRTWTLDTAQDIQTTASPSFAALTLTTGNLTVSAGDVVLGNTSLSDATNDLYIYAGSGGGIRMTRTGGTAYTEVWHNNTNGYVKSSTATLYLGNSTSSTALLVTGNKLEIYDKITVTGDSSAGKSIEVTLTDTQATTPSNWRFGVVTSGQFNIYDTTSAQMLLRGKQDGTITVLKGIGAFGVAAPTVQPSKISDPSGGATQDAEARTAINAIIDVLEGAGFAANA